MSSHGNARAAVIGGHTIMLTNPDKVMFPDVGMTKADVLAYYSAVAQPLITHITNRPVTRKRWVDGIGTAEHPGESFFQKNLDASTPEWVQRVPIKHEKRTNEYPLVNDIATLAWLVQTATLELHVPQWRFGPDRRPLNPDRLVLDLDPGEGVTLAECAGVARLVRDALLDAGLRSVPVTSGSKGIHVYAALNGDLEADAACHVASELARELEARHPDRVTSAMAKDKRRGRVFLDWSQNNGAKTTVAPYSLRGRPRATVAAPRTWDELGAVELRQLEAH